MDLTNVPNITEQDETSESEKLEKQLISISREFYITGMTDKEYLKLAFADYFKRLYHQSYQDNYFWQYCPCKVYETYLMERQNEYFERHFDSTPVDFWLQEAIELNEYYKNEGEADLIDEVVTLNAGYVFQSPNRLGVTEIILDFLPEGLINDIKSTTNKKISFLESKIFPSQYKYCYGVDYYLVDDLNSLLKFHNIKESNLLQKWYIDNGENDFFHLYDAPENPVIHLDYSNNPIAERIVFLHELGILDYLQKKMIDELHGFSANKLAEIVSSFIDVPCRTAQSYLNPIYSPYADQRKNPATPKNLEKVKNKLKDIGFSTTKTT